MATPRRHGRLDLDLGPPLRSAARRWDHTALRSGRDARCPRGGHVEGPARLSDVLRSVPESGTAREVDRRHRPRIRRSLRARIRCRLARTRVPGARLHVPRGRHPLRPTHRGAGDHLRDARRRRSGHVHRRALHGRRGQLRARTRSAVRFRSGPAAAGRGERRPPPPGTAPDGTCPTSGRPTIAG